MEIVFWVSVLLILYAYAGYPLSLAVLARFIGKTYKHTFRYSPPSISIIITATNEEQKIAAKLENTLALTHPEPDAEIQIVVTLDGATDNTAQIVRQYIASNPERKIVLLENAKGGKESAQQAAIQGTSQGYATGDILVFTDVATRLDPDNTLYALLMHFADERIGAVDGMSRIDTDGSSEGLYLKYENKIREYESKLGSLVTMGGCLFAVRREIVWKIHTTPTGKHVSGFRPDRQSDFRTALMTKLAGYQAILDKNAVATFNDIQNPSKEFERKHRTVVRGIATLFSEWYMLLPTNGRALFAYQLFCHKILKWLVPFFMISALIANAIILFETKLGFKWAFLYTTYISQCTFYALAIAGYADGGAANKYTKTIYFFVMSNFAILKAWFSYAIGKRYVSWGPTKR